MRVEDLQSDAVVRGILPDAGVTVVSVEWHGSDALTVVYRGSNGKVADEILYRPDEPRLAAVETGRPWSFDADGALFRLVSEAHRIRLAHLFDPVLAVPHFDGGTASAPDHGRHREQPDTKIQVPRLREGVDSSSAISHLRSINLKRGIQ